MTDDQNSPGSIDDLEARLRRSREKAGLEPKPHAGPSVAGSAGRGLHASIEFVVNTLVGAGLGYGIGYLAGYREIGLVLGLFIGFAAALRSMIRTMSNVEAAGQNEEQDGDVRDAD